MMRAAAVVAVLWMAGASADAQIPRDDSLPEDSVLADTVDQTARFLEAQQQVGVRANVLSRLGTSVPLPPRNRIVFDRDSIEWTQGVTVGDLLAGIPGTYVWRGGWYGRAESVQYQGRGATSVQYLLDGLPYLPIGIDSVGVDPALVSTSFLDRIEVERLPGQLRVHLFTRRHDRMAPRSRVAVSSGDGDFARYEGELERRFPSGFGFSLAADYLNTPTVAARSSTYSNAHVWLQGSYLPSAKLGLQYQLVRSTPDRRPFVIAGAVADDTLAPGYEASRTDAQLRLSYRARGDGLGPSLDVLYGRTGWDGGGIDERVDQVGGAVSLRGPTLAVSGSALYRSRWTPLDLRASAGWTAAGLFSAGVDGVYQTHDGDRSSRWVVLRAGLEPIRGVTLTGAARLGREVAAPALTADTTQDIRDYEAALGWSSPRAGFDVSYARTSAYAPFAPAEFPRLPTLAGAPEAEWLTLAVRVAPLRWVTLESWYSNPRDDVTLDGIPPTHSVSRATIRSKFLRTFPSGAFDLKLQVSMESWGTGVIGQDATGAAVTLPGATFFRSLIQFQIGRFSAYWDRGNLTATNLGYVPGFRIPPYGTTFGVRWEFLN